MKKKDKNKDVPKLTEKQKQKIVKEIEMIKKGKRPPFLNEELIFD